MSQDLDDRRRTLASRALAKWGETIQLRKLAEECGELLVEAMHTADRGEGMDRVLEEVADVENVLAQVYEMIKRGGWARSSTLQACLDDARAESLDKLERLIEADT